MNSFLRLTSLAACLSFGAAPRAADERVWTRFLNDGAATRESTTPSYAAYKQSLREVLSDMGVEARVRANPGRRFLLKIAHNDGRGIEGYNLEGGELNLAQSVVLLRLTGGSQENLAMRLFLGALESLRGAFNPLLPEAAKHRIIEEEKKLFAKALGSWNRTGYPTVVSGTMVGAWVELVREWGGEAWVGDLSGIESPDTYANMRASGVMDAVRAAGGHLWIFNRGEVDLRASLESYFRVVDGQELDVFRKKYSPIVKNYGKHLYLPSALLGDFFAGVVFAAYPKSHVLAGMTNAIKNFVGVMDPSQRRHMHHVKPGRPDLSMIFSHNRQSDEMISEMALGIEIALGERILGYVGDSIATLTNGGPDNGPATFFPPENWSVTGSNSLLAQELATLLLSFNAAHDYSRVHPLGDPVRFNPYFRHRDPMEIYVVRAYVEKRRENQLPVPGAAWTVGGDAPPDFLARVRADAEKFLPEGVGPRLP